MSAFIGKDLDCFGRIVTALITCEDLEIINPSEDMRKYLLTLEKIGSIKIIESEEGFLNIIVNKVLQPLFEGTLYEN